MHALDLNRRVWTKTRGDITAIGTWVRLDRSWKPCMVLLPAGGELDDKVVPCVITQERAWIWSREVGIPQQTVLMARKFAHCLRLSDEPRTLIFIASFIEDLLGDLLHVPPFPKSELEEVAEVTLHDNSTGKVLQETVLTE